MAEVFRYEHPVETVDRLKQIKRPCKGCRYDSLCEFPCERYLQWYNSRIKIAQIMGRRE